MSTPAGTEPPLPCQPLRGPSRPCCVNPCGDRSVLAVSTPAGTDQYLLELDEELRQMAIAYGLRPQDKRAA